jgi:HlyD family secretion protein
VMVVREARLARVPVETGLRNWDFVEVTRGLAPGDRIVVSLDRPEVRDGARVRIEGEAVR